MPFSSVKKIITAIKNKDISATELTREYFTRIKKNDDALNCFITLTEDSAADAARKIDDEISKNKFRPLSGLPIAQKDIFVRKISKLHVAQKCLITLSVHMMQQLSKNLMKQEQSCSGKLIWMNLQWGPQMRQVFMDQ